MPAPSIVDPVDIAELWERWCGETPWSISLREFAAAGGRIRYWCGMPRCASATPLTFSLHRSDGSELPCSYRLKDIKAAIATLRDESTQQHVEEI